MNDLGLSPNFHLFLKQTLGAMFDMHNTTSKQASLNAQSSLARGNFCLSIVCDIFFEKNPVFAVSFGEFIQPNFVVSWDKMGPVCVEFGMCDHIILTTG